LSHFSVIVRVPGEVRAHQLEARVGALLDPYCEHTDDGRLARFFEFVDEEDKDRETYETEGTGMIRLETGDLVLPWDERFRVPGTFGTGTGTHEAPTHLERVEVPHKERFATFDIFMKEWSGEERDPETGRYGSRRNPRSKWDYWRVGGRWRGHLRVLPGVAEREHGYGEIGYEWEHSKGGPPREPTRADWCRISALDFPRAEAEGAERVEKFWSDVDRLLSGFEFPWMEGPRDALLDLGFLVCKERGELTGREFWTKPWERKDVDRFDVIAEKPDRAASHARLLSHFFPMRPWATLDGAGWQERGRMGWWGMSSDTPESNAAFSDRFQEWIRSGDPSDWLVVTDCHV
jgi:hypothetical protein